MVLSGEDYCWTKCRVFREKVLVLEAELESLKADLARYDRQAAEKVMFKPQLEPIAQDRNGTSLYVGDIISGVGENAIRGTIVGKWGKKSPFGEIISVKEDDGSIKDWSPTYLILYERRALGW